MRHLFVTDKCAGREGGWCGYCLLDGNGMTILLVRPHSDAVDWWGLLVTRIIKLCMDILDSCDGTINQGMIILHPVKN